MSVRRLIERLTFRSREGGRDDTEQTDPRFGDYTDQTIEARMHIAGVVPPEYGRDGDDGHAQP